MARSDGFSSEMARAEERIEAGDENSPGKLRFEFGRNWRNFLAVVDEPRIAEAERSLREMLGCETLADKTFLDVGCGSGLFSLAAVRLGAPRVHSFDSDPESVACAEELRRRCAPIADHWRIERGSALDAKYVETLGEWDVVYSWGVLHHTGEMWRALRNTIPLVARSGTLFISIYNDQGLRSRLWARVKRLYNSGRFGRLLVVAAFVPIFAAGGVAADLVKGRNPLARYRRRFRGMSGVHDWFDWLGGFPFEVAKPDEIVDFYVKNGFDLRRLRTVGQKLGCNEFVFVRR